MNMDQRIESRIESMGLELQIESLRAQLHEAEELRHAISHGQVDAFIVGPTEDSKRVLMLSGAYARYRQLVEEMQQGAVTVSRSGEIMFANQAFAAMVGLAPIDIFRVPLARYPRPPTPARRRSCCSRIPARPRSRRRCAG